MLAKGKVSYINYETKKVEVILPEYDNAVTQPLRLYCEERLSTIKINDFVVVLIFNDDFNDAMIL